MVSESNVINLSPLDVFQRKSDWSDTINYFECFLKENYKVRYTIDSIRNVKQYIDWCFSSDINKCFILSKENFSEYEIYLQDVEKYKRSTVLYKIVALHKLREFLIKLNQQNSNEKSSNRSKRNRSYYNYLTKLYIVL